MCELDAEVESRITHFRRIVDFRNLLAHGYHKVNHELVWQIIQSDLPVLEREIQALDEAS